MSPKIVVTGIGIITSIGKNADEMLDALVNKRSGIGPISILDTVHKNDFLLGEIKNSIDELVELADVDPALSWTRTTLLGVISARDAVKDATLDLDSNQKTGLISATTVGGMDRSELFYKDFLNKSESNPYIDTHHAGDSTEKIAETLGIKDYLTTISTACSSSLNSIMFGARLIGHGIIDRAVVGGTDALSKFTINGFNTLMILDKEWCRPFDATRMGLNLGEGAAYLVLEREIDAIANKKKIYAEVVGYANVNDAFHQTASSEDGTGPFLAMEKALEKAELKPREIDYINVHGTGTDNNDLTEGIAMKRLFGEELPPFSSTKSYTGHTLGAAGAVESIISILSLNSNTIFPNINFSQQIEELGISPETEVTKKEMRHVLTNSFGFGGNDSSVVFSKWKDLLKNQEPRTKNQDTGLQTQGSRLKTQDPRLKTQDSRLKNQDSRLKTPIYINGIGAVAPTETFDPDHLFEVAPMVESKFLEIVKPNYKEYINPKILRRMSKIVRMGIVAAKVAMKDAGIEEADAIITSTGMGCQIDTEKFLNSMLDNGERLLNPTSFIQSTHNTIGAQVALLSGNNNYNLTYVHRTFSFESGLLDAMMMLHEKDPKQILLGGIDEITDESWLIKSKIGFYAEYDIGIDLLVDKREGALSGESASFFVLSSEQTADSYAKINGVHTFFQPDSQEEINRQIISFLATNDLKVEDIDLVMMGYNGDANFDLIYEKTEEEVFQNNTIGYYKHLCGEHDTASAFATWIAAHVLKSGFVPELLLKKKNKNLTPKRVLIYNQFRNINHSLILLEKV